MPLEAPDMVVDDKTQIYLGSRIKDYVSALKDLGYYIFAPGHTKGNSIVIVEDGGLNYIIHGDVTYTDEALYENRLSVVFEDWDAAVDTLTRVRQFIRENPTVYVSTHTPLGYENLEAKRVVDLDNMPEPIPPGEIKAAKATGKYVCSICGQIYDPAIPSAAFLPVRRLKTCLPIGDVRVANSRSRHSTKRRRIDMTDEEIIRSFHSMFDNFPEPVMITLNYEDSSIKR